MPDKGWRMEDGDAQEGGFGLGDIPTGADQRLIMYQGSRLMYSAWCLTFASLASPFVYAFLDGCNASTCLWGQAR